MTFGNTYVKHPVGHHLHRNIHRATGWHGWCYTHNLWVSLSQFQQGFTKYILELGGHSFCVALNQFAGIWVELSWCMPYGLVVFCRCIAMSFLCMKMQQLRTFHVLQLSENAYQFLDIMSIVRAEIADIHALEDILLF